MRSHFGTLDAFPDPTSIGMVNFNMSKRDVIITPKVGENTVAFWRIKSGRIVAILFDEDGKGTYRYQFDNKHGRIIYPKLDNIFGLDEIDVVDRMDQKVARAYKTAKRVIGAPVYVSCYH